MRITWVISRPVGVMRMLIDGANAISTSGNWIDVSANELVKNSDIELSVISPVKIGGSFRNTIDGVTYIGVPIGDSYLRTRYSQDDIKLLNDIIRSNSPDIIQIWGTESIISRIVAESDYGVPKIVYVQGVMQSIAKYPSGNLTKKEMCNSPVDRILFHRFSRPGRYYELFASNEINTLKSVNGVISDNKWCFMWCTHVNENIKCYSSMLQIDRKYVENEWECSSTDGNTIFTVADRGGYKGLQILLKAIGIVKKRIPDVNLIVPGKPTVSTQTRWTDLYGHYIQKTIKDNGIAGNVIFSGPQNVDGMIQLMRKSSLFVMPSICENHSSSLREAMTFGMPCVSSFVGSTGEFVDNYNNAIIYRYEEYEILAEIITQVLTDREMAIALGRNARKAMTTHNEKRNEHYSLYEIYKKILMQ